MGFQNCVHKQRSQIIKLQLARPLYVEYNDFYVDSKKREKKLPFNLFSFSLSLSICRYYQHVEQSVCIHMPNRGITGNN